MKKCMRLVKAILLAALALTVFATCIALAVWTKGLFIVLVLFSVLVWLIYSIMESEEEGW